MDIILRGYIESKLFLDRLRQQSGQPSLEYIAIAVGLVILVTIGFVAAGGNIRDEAKSLVDRVLDKTPN